MTFQSKKFIENNISWFTIGHIGVFSRLYEHFNLALCPPYALAQYYSLNGKVRRTFTVFETMHIKIIQNDMFALLSSKTAGKFNLTTASVS